VVNITFVKGISARSVSVLFDKPFGKKDQVQVMHGFSQVDTYAPSGFRFRSSIADSNHAGFMLYCGTWGSGSIIPTSLRVSYVAIQQ